MRMLLSVLSICLGTQIVSCRTPSASGLRDVATDMQGGGRHYLFYVNAEGGSDRLYRGQCATGAVRFTRAECAIDIRWLAYAEVWQRLHASAGDSILDRERRVEQALMRINDIDEQLFRLTTTANDNQELGRLQTDLEDAEGRMAEALALYEATAQEVTLINQRLSEQGPNRDLEAQLLQLLQEQTRSFSSLRESRQITREARAALMHARLSQQNDRRARNLEQIRTQAITELEEAENEVLLAIGESAYAAELTDNLRNTFAIEVSQNSEAFRELRLPLKKLIKIFDDLVGHVNEVDAAESGTTTITGEDQDTSSAVTTNPEIQIHFNERQQFSVGSMQEKTFSFTLNHPLLRADETFFKFQWDPPVEGPIRFVFVSPDGEESQLTSTTTYYDVQPGMAEPTFFGNSTADYPLKPFRGEWMKGEFTMKIINGTSETINFKDAALTLRMNGALLPLSEGGLVRPRPALSLCESQPFFDVALPSAGDNLSYTDRATAGHYDFYLDQGQGRDSYERESIIRSGGLCRVEMSFEVHMPDPESILLWTVDQYSRAYIHGSNSGFQTLSFAQEADVSEWTPLSRVLGRHGACNFDECLIRNSFHTVRGTAEIRNVHYKVYRKAD